MTDCVMIKLLFDLEENSALLVFSYFDGLVRCFEVQCYALPCCECVAVLKRSHYLLCGGQCDMLRDATQRVCVAYCAVQDKSWVEALCRDNVQLSDGGALRPSLFRIFSAAWECLRVPCVDFFLEQCFEQSRVTLCLRPIPRAMQKLHSVEGIICQV